MQAITFLNEKGGVGKTTLSTTLAAGLAILGKIVLLVDADPQGHATISLGFQKEPSFHDMVIRKTPFERISYVVPPERYVVPDNISDVKGELILVPGDKETRNIAQNTDDAFGIIERVAEITNVVDYIIFDTSPTPSLLHSMIYMATDGIIYPTMLEALSLDGIISSIKNRRNYDVMRSEYNLPPTKILGLVPTMTTLQTLEHRANLDNLIETFGEDMVWQAMPRRIVWTETTAAKKSIFAYDPTSTAAKDGWQLIRQFMTKVGTNATP